MDISVPLKDRLSCTVQEARALTGLSEASIYKLLKERAADGSTILEGEQVKGRWLVRVPSLRRLIEGDRAAA